VELDEDTCWKALLRRDAAFDGRFFVCVSTTGIYCRPVCPARTPRRDRCAFHRRAADAERAGYRACFRCRPELAPGQAPVDAVKRLVRVAKARIDGGALDGRSVEDLARALGVTSRHLRRAMVARTGLSPVAYAQARRLARARRLLRTTRRPLAEIAFEAGFSSVRRFNALFRSRYGAPPSTLRHGERGEA
jgi:AraC family transcriptional regulator of adaptative response / DNA-3-methyladenine glycosylase II